MSNDELEHKHVLMTCELCDEKHCVCISCQEAAEYMAADEELMRYAEG